MRLDGVVQRKRRRCRYDQNGVPVMVAQSQDADTSGGVRDAIEYIVVWLDVCRNFAAYDGMVYVTLAVTYKNSSTAMDTKGLYVRPNDLKIPQNRDVDRAMTKIVMD
jgi:hypothetical protein